MPRKNVRVFDFAGSRMLYRVDSEDAAAMEARGVCFRLYESPLTLALSRPPHSAESKRGLIQSLHPSVSKAVAGLNNESRKRGTLVRGNGAGFENALLAGADGTADEETRAALDGWKPKRLPPTPDNADVVPERAILFFPDTGSSR